LKPFSKASCCSKAKPESSPYAFKPGRFSSHGQILQFLQTIPKSKRILDLGTATGYLGKEIKQLGFRSIYGVEVNPDWARQAEPFYEAVLVQDLEHPSFPWSEGMFDVIICADVLEHLKEPAALLEQVSGLLSEQGTLLISLPNVAHWSVRWSLLLGRFQYTDAGILDRSHLRFFTQKTARQLLSEGGWVCRQQRVIPLPVARLFTHPVLAPPLQVIETVDWLLGCLHPPFFAYQFLFVVQKRSAV